MHLKFCDITLSVDCAKCKSGLKRFRDKTYDETRAKKMRTDKKSGGKMVIITLLYNA